MRPGRYGAARAPVPNDRPEDPRASGFPGAANLREQVRFAPHLIVLEQFTRVMEAMSAGVDPLPAYKALAPPMYALGVDDDAFNAAMDEVEAACDEEFDKWGHMDRLTWVEWHMVPMWDLAVRFGIVKVNEVRLTPTDAATRGRAASDAREAGPA